MRNNKNYANTRLTALLKTLAIGVAVCGASPSASAQAVGPWSLAVGYNNIVPQGTSDALGTPSIVDSKTKIGSDAQPIVSIGYLFTDHISALLVVGAPYTHKLSGAGSLQGADNFASVKQLPPTLLGQYRFLETNSPLRPYVGIGLTYAAFRDGKGSGTLTAISNPGGPPTTFTVDNAWGLTTGIGLTYAFNSKWYSDFIVSKTFISTTAHFSTGQTANVPLNPVATALSLGYRF